MQFFATLGLGLVTLLGLLIFVTPFIELRMVRRLQAAPNREGRLQWYRFGIITLWLLAALSWIFRDGTGLLATYASGDALWLFGAGWRTWGTALLLFLFFAVAFQPGLDCLFRPKRVTAYTRAMKQMSCFLPHDAQQRRWWVWLSVTAGVCEEWIFRGVIMHGLHAKGISLIIALLISSVIFGLNHLYQGWKAVGSTALIGFAFGLLTVLSGGLLLPILVHMAMDMQVLISFRPERLPQNQS